MNLDETRAMYLGQRIAVVAISWALGFIVLLAAGTFVKTIARSPLPSDQTMISQASRDGRSLWCMFVSRDVLEQKSRWDPATGPVPLAIESAATIAQADVERIVDGRHDVRLGAPALNSIRMNKYPERGDFYYYKIEFSTAGSGDTEVTGAVFVLLDGSTIRSRSADCPVPRFGKAYGFLDDVNPGFVPLSAAALFVAVAAIYSPLAVFIGPRVRRGLIVVVAIIGLIGTIAAFSRASLGLDYPLLNFPSGVEFGALLGALPAMLMIEFLVRHFIPSGEKRHAT
jgi:hypothetical protein